MLQLTYRLQQEGAGVHSRSMVIPTNAWYTTSMTDLKTEPLYRYTETAGADKNRWSVIHFWRTGTKQLYTQRRCDHYCSIEMVVCRRDQIKNGLARVESLVRLL